MAETRTAHVVGAEHRGRGAGQLLALIGAAVAIAAIVALLVGWPEGGTTVSDSSRASEPALGSVSAHAGPAPGRVARRDQRAP